MLKLFNAIKNNISAEEKKQHYRQYSHAELKIIAMRTRMTFQELYKKQSLKISQADSQFKKVQSAKSTIQQQYEILQEIGKKIIEVQTIKLFIELLRKIEAYSPQVINTKGDVSLLKQQILWFQSVLWYRRCKNVKNIEQFSTFCWNFFKGVDITAQINLKCQIFQLYPSLAYLNDEVIIPLQVTVEKCIPFVSFEINQESLNLMKNINTEEIQKKEQIQRLKRVQSNPFLMPNDNLKKTEDNKSSEKGPYDNKGNQIIVSINSFPGDRNGSSKRNTMDDEFAIDPYSRVRPESRTTTNQCYNNKFTSPNLNLIDWEAEYRQNQNPYVNSSQIRLNSQQLSQSSSQYDETTLPYPPSGVIHVHKKQSQTGQLKSTSSIFDSFDDYTPTYIGSGNENITNNDTDFQMNKDRQSKQDEISYVRKLQNQIFCKNNRHTFGPQNETQNAIFPPKKDYGQRNHETQSKSQSQSREGQKKSFNRLFGFKMKSNVEAVTNPLQNQMGLQKKKQCQETHKPAEVPFIRKTQSNYEFNQIDNMLDSISNIDPGTGINAFEIGGKHKEANYSGENVKNQEYLDKNSEIESLILNRQQSLCNKTDIARIGNTLDEINQVLEYQNDCLAPQNQDQDEQILSEFQSYLNLKQNSPYQPQQRTINSGQTQNIGDTNLSIQGYHIDECQKSLKKFSQSQEKYHNGNFDGHSVYDQVELSNLNDETNPQTKTDDHRMENISQIKTQGMYKSLEKDIFQSLMIIRRCFGRAEQSNQEQNSQIKPTAKLVEQEIGQTKNKATMKKPYMVSIYARQQFMDMVKNRAHFNNND